ncbi:MAG: substrate-binding domain-containing protein [Candidatus Limnocylindria bacterium]
MSNHGFRALRALALLALLLPASAGARDQIRIVGSSTVYPFATVVAEQFGRGGKFKTPIVESTGTGGGLKLFCAGAGSDTPDVANASRRIKASEVELCAKNGVAPITEVKIGYDGIVLAHSKKAAGMNLTRRQLFLALAKDVPGAGGGLVANPHKTWKDVDPSLPARKIEVLGPPPTSGTRDAFNELAIEAGCKTFPELAALDASDNARFKKTCLSIREDGAYVEAGENDNLIVQKLVANANAVGVFGYSFLSQNTDTIGPETVEGVTPDFEEILAGKYPLSRPLYIYVKDAHAASIPGLREFVNEFASEKAIGEYGYLVDKGLIPAPNAERDRFRADAANLTPLDLAKP